MLFFSNLKWVPLFSCFCDIWTCLKLCFWTAQRHWDFPFLMSWILSAPNTERSPCWALRITPHISPAAYFHGNKSIMPDIRLFLSYAHTATRHSRGKTQACGSLQSTTRGIKNRDGCWIYKYGGGSQNLSLNRPSDQDSGRVTQGPDNSGCGGTARVLKEA